MDSHFLLSGNKKLDFAVLKAGKNISLMNYSELENFLYKYSKKNEGLRFKFEHNRNIKESDLFNTNVGIPVLSENFKNCILSLCHSEIINWLSVEIQDSEGTVHNNYFILSFVKKMDVLDKKNTIYESFFNRVINGAVRKPVFDSKKIQNLNIFHQPNSLSWKYPTLIYGYF